MDIKHLQYFLEVSNTESFTKAAENLYISQPALSRTIKTLEEDLGISLFNRSRKKVTLTEAGKILYKHSLKIKQEMTELEQELDEQRSLKTGNIRIGLPTVVNSFFFSKLFADFHKQYPGVTFHLEEKGSKVIIDKIYNEIFDCGVVVLNHHMPLNFYTFVEDQLQLVVSSHHPLAKESQVQIDSLRDESFIMFKQDFESRDIILQACKQHGFEPKIVSETSRIDFLEEMVTTNMGITLLPETICRKFTRDIVTIPITNPSLDWNLAFIWNQDAYLSSTSRQFISFTKNKLGTDKYI